MPPLLGERRCLTHGGPAAAGRFRDRQLEALGRGEIAWEEFQRHERRRAVNRLRGIWKKAPWTTGATIDLGEHEDRFRVDMRSGGFDVAGLAPAVADTCRWRWRRLRLDRNRLDDWRVFLTGELPDRIRRAGPRPADMPREAQAVVEALFRVEGRLSPMSKRRRQAVPRAPKKTPRQPKRPSTPEIDEEALARVLVEHGNMIRRIAGNDADARMTRRLAALLNRVLTMPDDPGAGEEWRRAVAECAALR